MLKGYGSRQVGGALQSTTHEQGTLGWSFKVLGFCGPRVSSLGKLSCAAARISSPFRQGPHTPQESVQSAHRAAAHATAPGRQRAPPRPGSQLARHRSPARPRRPAAAAAPRRPHCRPHRHQQPSARVAVPASKLGFFRVSGFCPPPCGGCRHQQPPTQVAVPARKFPVTTTPFVG